MTKPVRVRFAPSPTGSLHLGGARTALYNYAFARHHGGKFILRVEDTDQERSSLSSQLEQIKDLQWLGLTWDEGPDVGGSYGPYRQSERLDRYRAVAEQLMANGLAFACFLTDDEIEALREQHGHQWQSPYRDLPVEAAKERIANGEDYTVRFKVQDRQRVFTYQDLVRGEIKLPVDVLGDFVLLRSGGMPVYNFCCVLDDYWMEITHVFRGEEHLPNTLKQLILYDALGWQAPDFGHLSVIVNETRKKLSKRDGAVSCDLFRDMGYLPEALLNGIALLGWSHPEAKDIFTLEDMVKHFNGQRLGASSALFDREKIKWTNSQHIKSLTHDQLWEKLQPFAGHYNLPTDPSWPSKMLGAYQTELNVLSEIGPILEPFDQDRFSIDADSLALIKSWPNTKALLSAWRACLEQSDHYLSADLFSQFLLDAKANIGVKGKELFMPLRVVLIGRTQGAEMKELIDLLPISQMLQRTDLVLKEL